MNSDKFDMETKNEMPLGEQILYYFIFVGIIFHIIVLLLILAIIFNIK